MNQDVKLLTTTLVFLRRDDEVLLAMKKRGHGEGHWNGAGGKIDPGETIEQAMVRECQEEIGVTPTAWEQIGEADFYQLHRGEPCKNTVHVYICTEWTGEPVESEEMAPQWFRLADVPYDRMWPDSIHWLPQLFAGQKIRGSFRYNDDNVLQTHEITEVAEFA